MDDRIASRSLEGDETADVVIVGGGPAGAALAIRLAAAGVDVVVLERAPRWRWRAGGVFASPAAAHELAALGIDEATLARVVRRIPAMRLETPGGAEVRLTYGAEDGGPMAIGLDRSGLDPVLLDRAVDAGARVRAGTDVRWVKPGRGQVVVGVRASAGDPARVRTLRARIVVGADGPRSVVADATGVRRAVRLAPRVGLSWHQDDPRGDRLLDARMHVIRDGYVGVAPVPGGRVNIGVVLGPRWRTALARDGAARVAAGILASLRPAPDDDLAWREGPPCDRLAGAAPLGVRVTRRAGPGWFLVGDAAGFLDPFTGEGLHRALVSATLAAAAIVAVIGGRAGPDGVAAAYDRAMRRRFWTKDAVSWLVQAFLARPVLLEYAARRLATRPDTRATMGLVMGDLVPAVRALDPRFLAAVLAP